MCLGKVVGRRAPSVGGRLPRQLAEPDIRPTACLGEGREMVDLVP